MILHQFSNGDTLEKTDTALIAAFTGKRRVLSTAACNGGYQDNLKWVFNQDCKLDNNLPSGMKAATYEGHMAVIASELGLDPLLSCGLSTAADMDNAVIRTKTYADTTVTAVVTGGIDVNGGRVGEPAHWHETKDGFVYAPGTINILLFIDADLSEGALAQALVTGAEAKTAAVQELMAPSCYSAGIATGSGTDGIIVVSDAQSPVKLTSAGKHCKLGELIGRTVIDAVREALFLQTGICAVQQFNIFRRIGRFGVTEDSIRNLISAESVMPEEYRSHLDRIARDHSLVVQTILYVHLLDELQWGLLDAKQVHHSAQQLLQQMGIDSAALPMEDENKDMIVSMINAYSYGIAGMVAADILRV